MISMILIGLLLIIVVFLIIKFRKKKKLSKDDIYPLW